MPRRSVADLPSHLLSYILCQLDCIHSLGSAILSHSCFLLAFKEYPDRPVADILNRQISPHSMPYAAALQELCGLDTQKLGEVHTFLRQRFCYHNVPLSPRKRCLYPGELDVFQAAAASKTHAIVNYFTHDFIKSTAAIASPCLQLNTLGSLCRENEVIRIQRALYRFQLYCMLLFRDTSNLHMTEERWRKVKDIAGSDIFRQFSPWVNEQLACIHDFLESVLSRAFDDVAAHEVYWGNNAVNWLLTGHEAVHKQAYLSFGLHFLYKLDQTQDYDKRLAIFESVGRKPLTAKQMLASLFQEAPNPGYARMRVRQFDNAELKLFSSNCTSPRDRYPSASCEMWREAHKDYFSDESRHNKDHYWLRRCGYVMWDIPKADFDKVFNKLLSFATQQRHHDELEHRKKRKRVSVACKQRAMIYQCGGYGYWSIGNDSRVQWWRHTGGSFMRNRPEGRPEDRARRNSM